MSATQVKNVSGTDAIRYDPYLEKRLRPILSRCMQKGIKIISNQGWADPVSAAKKVVEIAKSLGIGKIKVAAVSNGIDLSKTIADMNLAFAGEARTSSQLRDDIVSVEVYFGADGILEALKNGADVVITTRIVDSALYLGPLAYEFGWDLENLETSAKGSVVGHLAARCRQAAYADRKSVV